MQLKMLFFTVFRFTQIFVKQLKACTGMFLSKTRLNKGRGKGELYFSLMDAVGGLNNTSRNTHKALRSAWLPLMLTVYSENE